MGGGGQAQETQPGSRFAGVTATLPGVVLLARGRAKSLSKKGDGSVYSQLF